MANNSAPTVLHGFCKIVERQGKPRLLQTDQGKEFFNALFCRFCHENGIYHFYTKSETKASMVERFNRMLGTLLEQRVRSDKGILLQRAVRIEIDHYNRRPTSVFGFCWSPRQVHDDDGPDPALVWCNNRRVKRFLRRWPVETPQRRFFCCYGIGSVGDLVGRALDAKPNL